MSALLHYRVLSDAARAPHSFIRVCAETLYYVKDVAEAIRRLSSLGTYCLVTYTIRAAKSLDAHFVNMPSSRFDTFERGSWFWRRGARMVVWRNTVQVSRGSFKGAVARVPTAPPLGMLRLPSQQALSSYQHPSSQKRLG
jgi:hypothetical protein